MKKFVVNCDFGGQIAPFAVYIGKPEGNHHPLHFQADWLSKNRGGVISQPVMDALGRLKDIAERNNVSLEELCVYALGAAQQEMDAEKVNEHGSSDAQSTQHEKIPEDEFLPFEQNLSDDYEDNDWDDMVISPDNDLHSLNQDQDYEDENNPDLTLDQSTHKDSLMTSKQKNEKPSSQSKTKKPKTGKKKKKSEN